MDLILVPGLWLDSDSWEGVIPALEEAGHRVRAVPLPGLGGAGADVAHLGMQDWVEAIVAEIDAAPAPVVLVGHSGGGNAVWGAADRRPDRVVRAVFVDTVPPPPGVGVSEFEVVDGVVPFPGWDTFDGPDTADLDPSVRAAWAPRTSSVPARTVGDPLVLGDDDRFGVPVTLLMGSLDEEGLRGMLAPWGAFADEFAAIRDSEVVTLGTGHWPQFSRPDALAAAILAAVDR